LVGAADALSIPIACADSEMGFRGVTTIRRVAQAIQNNPNFWVKIGDFANLPGDDVETVWTLYLDIVRRGQR
jgi:hypothetical protein